MRPRFVGGARACGCFAWLFFQCGPQGFAVDITLGAIHMNESIIIALIGVTGAVIGSVATVAVQWLAHCLQEMASAKRDKPRKDLLRNMLRSPKYKWRNLDTLKHVVGADEETTKRLLLELGARASEDGLPLWGLVERNPLPEKEQ